MGEIHLTLRVEPFGNGRLYPENYSDFVVGGRSSLFQRGSFFGINSSTDTRKAFANITISRSDTPRNPVSMCEMVDLPILSKPKIEQRAAKFSCVKPPRFRMRVTSLPTILRSFPSSII